MPVNSIARLCSFTKQRAASDEAEANVDSFGLHFRCPVCGRRNRLVSHGEEDGILVLEQPATRGSRIRPTKSPPT